jgi:single stranded DNA-binding protein
VPSATLTTFTVATNEYRGGGAAKRTEYHPCVAWDRLAEITGQFLSKGQLVDIEGRLQTRQWDDDAGKHHSNTTGTRLAVQLDLLTAQPKVRLCHPGSGVCSLCWPDGPLAVRCSWASSAQP